MSVLANESTCFAICFNCQTTKCKHKFGEMNSNEKLRSEILKLFSNNPQRSTKSIARVLCINERTVKRAIQKFINDGSIKDKQRNGRPKGTGNKELEKKVLKEIRKNRSASTRDIAKNAGVSQSGVQKIKKRTGVVTLKKQKAPKRTPEQLEKAVLRAKRLLKSKICEKDVCIVLDDETYLKFDFNTLPGHQFYNVLPGEKVPAEETKVCFEKFGKKALVWQAICECGKKSTPFFTTGTMNTEIYIKECLNKRLLKFLREHGKNTLFWPDLAPAHYAKETLEWFLRNQVSYVEKELNPPNVPELRPIERYWAIMKAKLRKTGRAVKNVEELKIHWNRLNKKMGEIEIKCLMAGVREKIRNFANNKN